MPYDTKDKIGTNLVVVGVAFSDDSMGARLAHWVHGLQKGIYWETVVCQAILMQQILWMLEGKKYEPEGDCVARLNLPRGILSHFSRQQVQCAELITLAPEAPSRKLRVALLQREVFKGRTRHGVSSKFDVLAAWFQN